MTAKRITSLLVLANFIFSPLCALDIPLDGGTSSGKAGGASLGYVDMDRIFQIYPQTAAAKEDYAKQLKKKREQLAAKEAELSEVKNRIAVLESTIKQGSDIADPTAAAGESGGTLDALTKMKKDLEDKKTEVEEVRKQATADLAAFESQQSQLILGKIYQALRDVAVEQQVSVVVDKSSILYGDATIDLTEKLQQRVRGY